MTIAELVIDRLSQLGDGVGSWEGRAIFVPRALPGDRVRAEVADDGGVLRARESQLLAPGPRRREAVCSLAGRCGGCDWQELEDEAQREARTEIVLSSLEHEAGIARASFRLLPHLASPRPLGYRRRATFHFSREGLGLFVRRTHEVLPVPECPALTPALSSVPGRLTPLLAPLAGRAEAVHLMEAGGRVAFAVELKGLIKETDRAVAQAAVRALPARGAVLVDKDGRSEVIGRPALGIPAPLCPSLTLGARPDVFVQAHGEMTESLVRAGLGAAGDLAGAEVLELFSGHGAFTFALAAAARAVTAVESSGPALQLARKTAAEGGVTNVRFVQGDALKVAKGLADEKRGFDVLLADPPRTGATGIAPVAAALGVPRLVYVACSASSLARDAAALRGCGYVPQTLQLVEMFPQTRHVEAVMAFQRLSPP